VPVTEELLSQLRAQLLEPGDRDVSPSYRQAISDSLLAIAGLVAPVEGSVAEYPPGSWTGVLRLVHGNLMALARDLRWIHEDLAGATPTEGPELDDPATFVGLLQDTQLLLEWAADRLHLTIDLVTTPASGSAEGPRTIGFRGAAERRANWLAALAVGRARVNGPTEADIASSVDLAGGDLTAIELAREKLGGLGTLAPATRDRADRLLGETHRRLVTERLGRAR
jgi:hypothetical protein